MPASRSLPAFFILALALTGLVHSPAGTKSQTLQQATPTLAHRSDFPTLDGPTTSCLFDPERGEVPACIRQAEDGKLFVSRQVLKLLQFDSYGPGPDPVRKRGLDVRQPHSKSRNNWCAEYGQRG